MCGTTFLSGYGPAPCGRLKIQCKSSHRIMAHARDSQAWKAHVHQADSVWYVTKFDQSYCIWYYCHWYTMMFSISILTFHCYCCHQTTTKAASKSLVFSGNRFNRLWVSSGQTRSIFHQIRCLKALISMPNRLINRHRNILPYIAHTNGALHCFQCLNQLPRRALRLSCNTFAQNS